MRHELHKWESLTEQQKEQAWLIGKRVGYESWEMPRLLYRLKDAGNVAGIRDVGLMAGRM